MKKNLFWLWQLPQNLVGLLVVTILDARKIQLEGEPLFYAHNSRWLKSVSLGDFIIVNWQKGSITTIRHEQGHQVQSMYLGPLYLIVIGLPSLIGNLINRKVKINYYRLPWEHWADKLGGVER